MTLATATTVVRAVRKHGGGLVQAQQPRAHARGRQLTSRGGVINRRCEATSIIHSLFQSSAAAAYPLTGVRRARTLSPSLRFNNSTYAQLVVGYGYISTALLLRKPLKQFIKIADQACEVVAIYGTGDGAVLIQFISLGRGKPGQVNETDKFFDHFWCLHLYQSYFFHLGQIRRQLLCIEFRPANVQTIGAVDLTNQHVCANAAANSNFVESPEKNTRAGNLGLLRCLDLTLRRVKGGPRRYQNRRYRADSLHPSRPVDVVSSPRAIKQPETHEEHCDDDHRYRPGSFEPSERPNSKFRFQHGQHSRINKSLSLPAPRHHVQRGAA